MKRKAFLIMPFKSKNVDAEVLKKLDDFLDYLEVFCKQHKIILEKADDNYKNTRKPVGLIESIIADIEEADVIIADISANRPNVLYELGLSNRFELEKEKTIIVTQNKDEIPTDLKTFKPLDYTEREDKKKILSTIEKIITTRKEIRIGIAAYPELMLLYYGLQRNHFGSQNIKPILLKWNSLLDYLNRNEVDIVIGNRGLINKKNNETDDCPYLYSKTLFTYNSFCLIYKKDENIKTFSEIKEKHKGDILQTLFETLKQFNSYDETIVLASKETDHHTLFQDLNNRFYRNLIKNVHIVNDSSPQELFADFVQGNGNIYVGGIPERISITNNYNEKYGILLSCQDIKWLLKDFVQKNGFIYKKATLKETLKEVKDFEENVINNLYRGWNNIFKEIKQMAENADYSTEYGKYLENYNSSADRDLQITPDQFFEIYVKNNDLIRF